MSMKPSKSKLISLLLALLLVITFGGIGIFAEDKVLDEDSFDGENYNVEVDLIEDDIDTVDGQPMEDKPEAEQELETAAQASTATGVTTYEELLAAVRSTSSGGVIEIANDIQFEGAVSLNKSLTLRAAEGAGEVTLTAVSGYRHFIISGSSAIRFTTQNVVLDGNGEAGGIRTTAQNLTLNAVIRNCEATDKLASGLGAGSPIGGGIYVNGGKLTIAGGEISNNIARYGGGIYASGATLSIIGGTISDNTVTGEGGGVCAFGSTVTMSGGTITENTSNIDAGGIYARSKSTLTITGGEISRNTAYYGGGVGADWDSTLTIQNGRIIENTARGFGGGVQAHYITNIRGGEISGNTAAGFGGGVCTDNGSRATISGGKISDNTALYGGGIFTVENLTISGGEISRNTATSDGGGVCSHNRSISITIRGARIINNHAARNGGGIFVYEEELNKVAIRGNSVVKDNSSGQAYIMTRSSDISLHNRQVDSTVTWTSGFNYIYNNNDVVYTKGTPVPKPTVELTNMVQTADFSDLSAWNLVPANGYMEAENGTLTVTIDSTDDMYYITVRQDMQMNISHIYYVRSSMYFELDTFPGANYYYTVLNLGNNQLLNTRYTSEWADVSAIGSPSNNGTNRFQQLFRVSPTGNHLGGVMKCREPMVIDLTEAFGAGNEPTVEWCDANIPYFIGTTAVIV